MTYRNYRNSLHKLMLSYLHFMKCADTDEQLLALNSEANLLRIKIDWLDKKTASEMQETVKFDEYVFESDGFPDITLSNNTAIHFVQKVSRKLMLDEVKPKESKFKGVFFIRNTGKWRAQLIYKGKTLLDENYPTEDLAVIARDNAILKYHLSNPLHELKK